MNAESSGGWPCPRCGGEPAERRQPTAQNPFLSSSKKLVCSLCGLDYERGEAAWKPGLESEKASR